MGFTRARLGHGIGLRNKHFPRYFEGKPPVAWVEAISENFFNEGGRPLALLEKVRGDVPIALHGVSLSIGGTDPVAPDYLARLRRLVDRFQPAIVSDHLCWGAHGGRYAHDLLPLPYTEEALENVVRRVSLVQDALRRQILLENVSSYAAFRGSTMSEWDFFAEVARRADCGLLVDVNNIFVSAKNHGFEPLRYLDALPAERVGQIHLAGHEDKGTWLLDSHDHPVPDPVWALYREAVRRFGSVATLVEWDDHIPELDVLVAESRRAEAVEAEALKLGRATNLLSSPSPTGAAPVALAEALDVLWAGVSGDAETGRLEAAFLPAPGLSGAERVGIYASMVFWRQVEALREELPMLAASFDEHAFAELSRDYLVEHPSASPDIGRLGRAMEAFLRGRGLPALADLAALEWARSEVFGEAEVAPSRSLELGPEQFAGARLTLVPSLRLLSLGTDAARRWRALDAGAEVAEAGGPCEVAVWRSALEAVHTTLAPDEAAALRQVRAGGTLAEACEWFGGREDPAAAAFEAIASWLHEGWIASVA